MLGDRDYMRSEWYGQPHAPSWRETSVVNKIIMINVAIFILQCIDRYRMTPYTPNVYMQWKGITSYLWLSIPTLIEFWRLVTYMFVHGSFSHILFNMWGLYIFGKSVEERIGAVNFLKLYFLSGVLGAGLWLIFNIGSQSTVIGASGAVFGVMVAAAMLFPNQRLILIFPPVILKIKTLVIFYIAIELFTLYQLYVNKFSSGIAHLAHLGGALGGYLFIKKKLRISYRRGKEERRSGSLMDGVTKRLSDLFASKQHRSPDLRFVEPDDDEGNAEDLINAQIDPILDKIGKYGMKSLTRTEKKILERAREKLKERI